METATVAQTLQGGRTPFSSAARRWRFAAAHASPPPTQRPLPNCAGLRIEQTCDADWPMQLLPRLGQAGDAPRGPKLICVHQMQGAELRGRAASPVSTRSAVDASR